MKKFIYSYKLLLFIFMIISLTSCAAIIIGGVAATAGIVTYVATDPRKTNIVFDDNIIETKVYNQIYNDYPSANIYISCYKGAVLLTGQVLSEKIKSGALFDAKTIPGVIKIYDYIDVRLEQSVVSATQDSYTTTQIKSKLLTLDNIKSNNIKVVTTNSVVYLMGTVNQSDAIVASDAAATINGVTKVITLFDYTPIDTANKSNSTQNE